MGEFDMDLTGFVKYPMNLLLYLGNLARNPHRTRDTVEMVARAAIFLVILDDGLIIGEVISLYQSRNDLEAISRTLFLNLSTLVSVYKVLTFWKYRSRIIALVHKLNSREFMPTDRRQKLSLESDLWLSKLLTVTLIGAAIFTAIIILFTPMVVKSDKPMLPVAAYIPLDLTVKRNYVIGYVYQSVAMIFAPQICLAPDLFITSFIIFIGAQFKILNDKLRNMKRDAKTVQECQNDDALNRKLVECVNHHLLILEVAREFTFLFSGCVLWQFLIGAFIICFTLFQLTLVPFGSVEFISVLFYIMCVTFEIFMFCYFGNEVIIESNNLNSNAYHCDWIGTSAEFRKNLMFFMMRSNRELKLYAGGYFTLSLEMFVNIIKSSWSYFALLMQVNSRKEV